jgi:hypothetical protein
MPMMFFYFLKIIFDISTSKRSKRYKPHSILAKKKNLKFDERQLKLVIHVIISEARQIEKPRNSIPNKSNTEG